MDHDQQRNEAEAIERQKIEQAQAHQKQIDAQMRAQDDASIRAKNSRHGQVTADKWNQ